MFGEEKGWGVGNDTRKVGGLPRNRIEYGNNVTHDCSESHRENRKFKDDK